MQIVIPMAGVGKRFLDAGYKEPKPLIKVHGKPMIEHIINLFKEEDDFVFICNREHLKKHELKEKINQLRPRSKIIGILYEQLGPVWSTLQAIKNLKKKEPTIVTYCDFNMSWDYERFQKTVEKEDADGAVISYTGFHPHLYGPNKYAGVRASKNNVVLEVKEKHSFTKDKMKSWHSNGTYYFRNGEVMETYFRKLVDQKLAHDNGEYYVSDVYNEMIKDGLKILVYPIEHFCQWGTPEDLEQYNAWQSLPLRELTKKFPDIPKDGHKQALNYWAKFNLKRK